MKRSRRGRRQANPANKNYESNGPDVKVRGSANTVCEKYQTLARDALSAGDLINAENYFQHAEHYYRIIAANQAGKSEHANGEGDAKPPATGAGDGDNGQMLVLDKMNGESQNTPTNAPTKTPTNAPTNPPTGQNATREGGDKDNKSPRLGHLRRRRKVKAETDTDTDTGDSSASTG